MNVTSVYVEITNQCNLNCRTCYNRSGLNRTREELSCEDLEQLIQLFLPLGLKHLSLSGGEPTLHSAFDKVLGLTERYPQLQFSLTTNGTTNSRPLIDRMAAASNLALQISLDGSCEEVNAKTRGAGNFSRVMDLIRSLPAKKECRLKMVISQDNDNDIEAFTAWPYHWGCCRSLRSFSGPATGGSSGRTAPCPPTGKWRRCVLSTG